MANRQVGNFWIIDTVGKLGTQPATGLRQSKVAAVGMLSLDTTGRIQIAMAANTTNLAFDLTSNLPTAHIPQFTVYRVGGVYIDELQVITVTQGTAWLYLE